MVLSTRIFRNPYNAYCDVYACRNKAAWFIGRPDATKAATYKTCDECMTAMLTNLEDQLEQRVTQNSTDREIMSMPEPEPTQPEPTEQNVARALPISQPNVSKSQLEAQRAQTESTHGSEPSQESDQKQMEREEQPLAQINEEKLTEKKNQLEQAEQAEKIEQLKEEVEQMEEKKGHGMEESQIQPTLIDQLNNKTVEELKALAKDIGVKGYSKMKKEELVTVLAEGESMNE